MKITSITTGARLWLVLTSIVMGCTSPEEQGVLPDQTSRPETQPVERNQDTVEIKAMKFVPAEITVTPGTTLVFINNDMVSHDITEEAPNGFSSKLLPVNESWSMVAEKSANYFCSIHVIMKGRIIVTQ
jgi:plastocyanin